MDFTEINSRGNQGELLGRFDRQNSRFRTAKTIIIKFGLHASFVELESAKNAVNEVYADNGLFIGLLCKAVSTSAPFIFAMDALPDRFLSANDPVSRNLCTKSVMSLNFDKAAALAASRKVESFGPLIVNKSSNQTTPFFSSTDSSPGNRCDTIATV
ncbi:hypothetical protein TNCV_939931 [Trichonephila clavipes]|nr:hypothetical protein TNCV_939931 [Trichonephila clavipes]